MKQKPPVSTAAMQARSMDSLSHRFAWENRALAAGGIALALLVTGIVVHQERIDRANGVSCRYEENNRPRVCTPIKAPKP